MIIGVTGTNGAGKGTVVDYLVKEKGFAHHSVREFLLEEIRARGLPEDRSSMRDVANDLRQTHGPSHVGEVLRHRAREHGQDAVIESIRTIAEADFLKKDGAYLLAVDADRRLRYERAITRGSQTDKVTFEEFVEQEDREMAGTEPWDMNVFGVIERADARILNEGTREELHIKIEEVLTSFLEAAEKEA